jgi:thioredoxin-dependent peroxiredoxin
LIVVLFQLYHVEYGSILKYIHPAGLIMAVKATLQGYKHGKFEGHETQLPAVFIVAPDKTIKFAHYGKHISDIPSTVTMAANI